MAQQEEIQIIWRSFELRPDPVPPPDAAYIEKAFTNHVKPMAEQLGVTMNKPSFFARTRLCHEATAYARLQGKDVEMADAIFKAYWQQGRDISQIDVLCDVALSVGVDPVGLRDALTGRTLKEQVQQELDQAQRYGIDSVPFFIFNGRYAARGLQSEEGLRRAIGHARGEGLLQVE